MSIMKHKKKINLELIVLIISLLLIPIIIYCLIKGFRVSGKVYDYEHRYLKSSIIVQDVKHSPDGYITTVMYPINDKKYNKVYNMAEELPVGKVLEIYVNPKDFTDIVIEDTVPKNGVDYIKTAGFLIIAFAVLNSIRKEIAKHNLPSLLEKENVVVDMEEIPEAIEKNE